MEIINPLGHEEIYIILLALCQPNSGSGTDFTEHIQQTIPGQTAVKITQSQEITKLVDGTTPVTHPTTTPTNKAESAAEENDLKASTKQTPATYHGIVYRIQAYAGGNSRQAKAQAYAVQAKIKAALPNIPVLVTFQSPRWLCLAGFCQSQEEAQQLLQRIKNCGVPSAIIVRRNTHR